MSLRTSQKRRGDVSLQEPIGTDGGELHGEVERRVGLESVRRLVSECLDGEAHAQQEVASRLGISRS